MLIASHFDDVLSKKIIDHSHREQRKEKTISIDSFKKDGA